jgi:hypothetical protein
VLFSGAAGGGGRGGGGMGRGGGGGGLTAQQAAAIQQQGGTVIQITQAEKEAIDRLERLGFPRQKALEAFLIWCVSLPVP